jgi:hypothetical protein
MTPNEPPPSQPTAASREQTISALFANLVIQQTNTALILLGHAPNPETGERMQDLEAARLFIDQLEMLEVKTKGNLDTREDKLLKQSLTALRMAFVQAVEAPPQTGSAPATPTPEAKEAAGSGPGSPAPGAAPAASSSDESRKKFSKKY